MDICGKIASYISSNIGGSEENMRNFIASVLVVFIFWFVKLVFRTIYGKITIDARKRYRHNRQIQITLSIIEIVLIGIIWSSKLSKLLTLISVVSAAFTIALRDIIFNFFCGIYIRISKIISLEDRIEINDVKGDVVNQRALSFDVLEVGQRVNGEQSTGRIVSLPNSFVFTYPVKNYVRAFKYIWDEVKINVYFDCNIDEVKEILYKIVNENDIVKEIPKKMENEVTDASLEYRIYFNKLKPIIYTAIVENHVEMYIRYLVHPKKQRLVQDKITEMILEESRKGNIKLRDEV